MTQVDAVVHAIPSSGAALEAGSVCPLGPANDVQVEPESVVDAPTSVD
jgi:hypothetical protein